MIRTLPEIDVAPPASPSLSDIGYEALLDRILDGTLPAGTVLNERRLAASLSISRTPVRDALRRLETEGLVLRRPGQPPTVAEPSIKEFVETLAVRHVLETEAARLSVGHIPAAEITAVRALVLSLLDRGAATVSETWDIDDQVHGLMARHSDNGHLARLILEQRRKTHIFDIKRLPKRFLLGCKEHIVILDALEAGDRDGAVRAVGGHIDNVKNSILKKLQDL